MAETPPERSDEPLPLLNYASQADWKQSLRPLVLLALAMAAGRLIASIADSVMTFAATFSLPSGSDTGFSAVSIATGILLAVSQSFAAWGCVRILRGRLEALSMVAGANLAGAAISIGNAVLLPLMYLSRSAALSGRPLYGYCSCQAGRVFIINLALAGIYVATWRIFLLQASLFVR